MHNNYTSASPLLILTFNTHTHTKDLTNANQCYENVFKVHF